MSPHSSTRPWSPIQTHFTFLYKYSMSVFINTVNTAMNHMLEGKFDENCHIIMMIASAV